MFLKSATVQVGSPSVIDTESPSGKFGAVFEDDGETGYFYALDLDSEEKIQEALHIYNVSSIADRAIPSEVVIVWTDDGQRAGLFINSYPHAILDFAAKRGYCRSNFPEPSKWPCADFKWDERALDPFRKK